MQRTMLQSCGRQTVATKCSAPFSGLRPRRQQQQLALPAAPRGARSPRSSIRASAAQAAPGKLISTVEIPAFIPRSDILDQLTRWALIDVQENGVANLGCPCKVTPFVRDGATCGFTVSFLKDGVSVSDVRLAFDEEVTTKHEWVGKGADGFPVLEGNEEKILGKNFEIRKVCDNTVTEPIRAAIREFCTMLVGAINKYYAFGSCFVDDAT